MISIQNKVEYKDVQKVLNSLGYQVSSVLAIEAFLTAKWFPFEKYKDAIYSNSLNSNSINK